MFSASVDDFKSPGHDFWKETLLFGFQIVTIYFTEHQKSNAIWFHCIQEKVSSPKLAP